MRSLIRIFCGVLVTVFPIFIAPTFMRYFSALLQRNAIMARAPVVCFNHGGGKLSPRSCHDEE
jgi:hypothetical protein